MALNLKIIVNIQLVAQKHSSQCESTFCLKVQFASVIRMTVITMTIITIMVITNKMVRSLKLDGLFYQRNKHS